MTGGVCEVPGERCYHSIACSESLGCVKQRKKPHPVREEGREKRAALPQLRQRGGKPVIEWKTSPEFMSDADVLVLACRVLNTATSDSIVLESALVSTTEAADECTRDRADIETLKTALLSKATDAELLDAYQRTDGESAEADALLAEIEKRGLDI